MKQDFRFELGLPSPAAIAAWERAGGQWQFRFLEAAIVLHQLRIADEVIQIWSDGDKVWEPLFLLDDSAIEHRPSQRGAAINWLAFYQATALPRPYWLDRAANKSETSPQ